MEEFIHKESHSLHVGILDGSDITWPDSCRNCEHCFSEKEKTMVCQTLLRNPELDLLKVVRDVLMGERSSKVNYCCINNLRPQVDHSTPKEREENFSGVRGVFVEEGLVEWYNLTWEGDEEWIEPEEVEDKTFSLFHIQT
jgi:hypothetical protein